MDVIATLEEAGERFGLPQAFCVDLGEQFASREMDRSVYAGGVKLEYSRPLPRMRAFACRQQAGRRTTHKRRASTPLSVRSAWASTGS